MIAQLKQTLQQNAAFEKKNTEKAVAETSIKDRMKSLNNSANLWQQKVIQPIPATNRRRSSANILKEVPNVLNNAQYKTVTNEKPCDISSGLKKFFGTGSVAPYVCDTTEVDLDAISLNATPVLRAPYRPRAPNRKKTTQTNTFDERIRLNTIQINEEQFVEEEVEAEKLETQEQAISALKSAKQLLKSPTKQSPYPDVMLIQVRGQKHTDVRLVAPFMSSIHENACFVIVHQKHLMKYEGSQANILEKTKAAQLCIEIHGKGDLNCAAESIVTVTELQKATLSKLLIESENKRPTETNNNVNEFGGLTIEPFETTAARINLVFRIAEDKSAQTCSRREKVSYSILQPDETLVFDFGSEVYVWNGRNSSKVNATYGMEYAKQLMDKNVKNAKQVIGDNDSCDEKRPEWTLFRKIHQGVLDVLFQAKFSDWPDKEVMNTCRPKPLFSPKKPELKTYEDVVMCGEDEQSEQLALRILDEKPVEPMLLIEDQEIDRKMKDVVTEDISLWILEGEELIPIESTNTFESSKCYVMKWTYRIQKSGVRRIRTGKEEERETGRSRVVIFHWLGQQTTPKQHGLCALRIKEIDKDHTRIRVVDANEQALFLALFNGKFVVSSDSCNSHKTRRYAVVGGNGEETSLREIEDLDAKLRSHATYIDVIDGQPKILCGTNCSPEQVRFVLAHSEHLQQTPSSSVEKPIVEVQGDSSNYKWITSAGRKHSIRAWRLFDNEAEQVNYLSGHDCCSFTFSQQVLLSQTILIDVGEALWIWSEDIVTTFALKVANRYWKGRNGRTQVVYKGNEPEEFRALFLKWENYESEQEMKPRDLKELLSERCRTFSIQELKERTNLPAGMDMRRLESYLTDDDFVKAFGMNRREFQQQKAWKQNEARKKAGLF